MHDIAVPLTDARRNLDRVRCCKQCVHGWPYLHIEMSPFRMVTAALCKGHGRNLPLHRGNITLYVHTLGPDRVMPTQLPYPIGYDVKSEICPYRRAIPGHGAFKFLWSLLAGR